MGITVDLFVNEGFNSQCICPSISWHFLLLQLGLLRASWVVASGCAPGCDFVSLSLPSDQRDDDRVSGELSLV